MDMGVDGEVRVCIVAMAVLMRASLRVLRRWRVVWLGVDMLVGVQKWVAKCTRLFVKDMVVAS